MQSSAIYGILNFLPLASRLFLFPIFVNFLTPYDYGIIGLHATVTSLLTIIISGGLDSAFARFYFDFEKNEQKLESFFKTMLITVFLIGVGIGLILFLVGDRLYSLVFEDSSYTFSSYGLFSYLMAFGASINAVILVYFRNKEQPIRYFIFSGSCFILMITLETYTVFRMTPDASNVLTARLLGLFIPSVFFWLSILKSGISFKISFIRLAMKFGFPFLVYLLLGFFYLRYDRILVSNLLSIGELSIYNAAITIAAVIEISLQAIDMAILPTIYRWYKESEFEKISRILRYLGFFTLALIALILLFSPVFILRYTPSFYSESLLLIPIFIIGYIGRYYFGALNKPLYYYKKVNQLPIINIVAGVVLIVGNLLLIPEIGLIGAAMSMALSRLIMIPIVVHLVSVKTQSCPRLKYLNIYFFLLIPMLIGCSFYPHLCAVPYLSYYILSSLIFVVLSFVMIQNKTYLRQVFSEVFKS